MVIQGIYKPPAPALRPVRSGRAAGGFVVSEQRAQAMDEASGAAAVALPSLQGMQEAESAALQDRDARRHGTAVLDELSGLQRALLGAHGPDLGRLAQLAGRPTQAADPGLEGVLRAIRLRAGIELARYRPEASR